MTADTHVIHINYENDDDDDFKELLAKVVMSGSVDGFEINYSSETKTLRLFTSMSLQQLDDAFFPEKVGEYHGKIY